MKYYKLRTKKAKEAARDYLEKLKDVTERRDAFCKPYKGLVTRGEYATGLASEESPGPGWALNKAATSEVGETVFSPKGASKAAKEARSQLEQLALPSLAQMSSALGLEITFDNGKMYWPRPWPFEHGGQLYCVVHDRWDVKGETRISDIEGERLREESDKKPQKRKEPRHAN